MRDDQAWVGLDDGGFLDLPAVLVDEIMREGRTDRRFGEFGARLATKEARPSVRRLLKALRDLL
ncbi:hypothetical protein HFN01_13965 [Rhizobium leguminosarum]|uniref:hypothetical protein n=1 Tax=Rhizobium leguminosarum TaxID=384 RepID=UPI001C97E979|nr:hypothetical protein [Rhizobium leguminosarum]MBY5395928.1 hypothetical protein [Rhizobium leguminosarum]